MFGGTALITFDIPPWEEGWCAASGYGINAGSVTIDVSGPSVPFPISSTNTVPDSPATNVRVLFDAEGDVHFDCGAPTDTQPCHGYPELAPTEAP